MRFGEEIRLNLFDPSNAIKRKIQSLFINFYPTFFSGNPLSFFLFGKYFAIIGLTIVIIILNRDIKIEKVFLNKFNRIILGILIIGICQYLILNSISLLGFGNLLLKILLGALIISNLKEKFPSYFFKVIGILSAISLFFFFFSNLINNVFPAIDLGTRNSSYVIYTFSMEDTINRNAGMFWEPGAYAGILTLGLALNLNNLVYLWNTKKLNFILVLFALITTQSTTGYFVGFLILIFIVLKPKHFSISLIMLPLLLLTGYYIYKSNDFLKDKLESQFEKSKSQRVGDFSNTRFGSLVFDFHYIQKHPLIGNGLDKKTRYSDHQYLFMGQVGDVIGSGNSISHYWASMGVFFIIGYFVLLWNAMAVSLGKLNGLLIMCVVFFNLIGEQWFNYPLYLGLPFLLLNKDSYV